MYNRLKIIYQLQIIDDHLDELEELRGDLPKTVEKLEQKINDFKEDIKNKEREQKEYSLRELEEVFCSIHTFSPVSQSNVNMSTTVKGFCRHD